MATSGPSSSSKVSRLIAEYDLDGVGSDLEDRWTRAEDRYSLRQLAEYFNRQLLRAALARERTEPPGHEVETVYRHLVGEDVSSGVRTHTRARLERQNVDVEGLTEDFVSRQAIHTYLTKVREATPPGDDATPEERRQRKLEVVQRLKRRLVLVTETALAHLARTDRLTIGEFDVFVRIQVHCPDCATQRSVTELLGRGGCDCGPTDSPEARSR